MSILSCQHWTPQQLEQLFKAAEQIHEHPHPSLKDKILINVFFEPSTRTSLSFECAMKRLGGQVINFQKDTSSLKKGESFEDTIRTLAQYGDLMVLRHPQRGHVSHASSLIDIPVINAGDGSGEHPTQALLDLYTIYKHFGSDFMTKRILFVGDLKNSRTIHSLILLIHKYPSMKVHMLSYQGLEPDEKTLEQISCTHKQSRESIKVTFENINYSLFDVIYITRLQSERLESQSQGYCNFMLTNRVANKMKEDAIIMHPLPRNEEIHPEVDQNHRCVYFKQLRYGIDIRMALITRCCLKSQLYSQKED